MIAPPPQAAKALKEKEAEEKGKLWLEEVSRKDGAFVDNDQFCSIYEAPQKKHVEPNKLFKNNGEVTPAMRNAQAVTIVRDTLTSKLVLLTLDMACHLLQDLEKDEDPFVNAIRALVLTYRFEKPNMRRKTLHLRQVASQRLADFLELSLREETLQNVQQSFRGELKEMDTKPLMDQTWKKWMEDKFLQVKDVADMEESTSPSETVLSIAGLLPPQPVEPEVQSTYNPSLAFLRDVIEAKLVCLNHYLSLAMDQILVDVAMAKFSPDTSSKQALPMAEQLLLAVDKLYQCLKQIIEFDVSGVVGVLENLMRLEDK